MLLCFLVWRIGLQSETNPLVMNLSRKQRSDIQEKSTTDGVMLAGTARGTARMTKLINGGRSACRIISDINEALETAVDNRAR